MVTQVVIELEDWEAERGRLGTLEPWEISFHSHWFKGPFSSIFSWGKGKNRAPAKKKVQPRAEGWLLTRKPQDQRLLTPILHGPLKPAEGFGAPKEEQLVWHHHSLRIFSAQHLTIHFFCPKSNSPLVSSAFHRRLRSSFAAS